MSLTSELLQIAAAELNGVLCFGPGGRFPRHLAHGML